MKKLLNSIKLVLEKHFIICVGFFCLLIIVAILNKALAVGLILLIVLMCFTFWVIKKLGLSNKHLVMLLLIALVIHLIAVLFIYYADFQPFGGGYGGYKNAHIIAVSLSENIRQGDFSFDGVPFYEIGKYPYDHFSVVIGIIYSVTMPEVIVGQMFLVWLSVLTVLFAYLIIIEIGGSKKWAVVTSLIISAYPSYVFYSSLLLKDNLVIPLTLLGMLLCLKLIKDFSWKKFLIFYIVMIASAHLRFYIAYALLITFVICWVLLSKMNLKKKAVYTIIILILLGFLPQISANQGFYAIKSFKEYLNVNTIEFYQEEAYNLSAPTLTTETPSETPSETPPVPDETGFDSTWERKGDYLKSFIYVFLGPFPWQMKYSRHFFALLETIPWYLLLIFIFRGIWKSIKLRNKFVIPLILFSFLVILVISIFINNFGIITRIRIPAFIALLCLIPMGFEKLKTN